MTGKTIAIALGIFCLVVLTLCICGMVLIYYISPGAVDYKSAGADIAFQEIDLSASREVIAGYRNRKASNWTGTIISIDEGMTYYTIEVDLDNDGLGDTFINPIAVRVPSIKQGDRIVFSGVLGEPWPVTRADRYKLQIWDIIKLETIN